MEATVIGTSGFQSLLVKLDQGESFLSEAGKLVRSTSNVNFDVTTRKKASSGLMRMLAGDSFFFSTYQAQSSGAEVVVAPTLAGSVHMMQLDGEGWKCTGGSYLANSPGVSTDPEWQSIGKGLLSGESLVLVHCKGSGFLAVEAFGLIREFEVDGSFTIDNGHVVAFQDTLQYDLSKVGGSWMTSFLSGEGVVLNFKGQGKVLVQSHNPSSFGQAVGPKLPPR